MGCRSAAERLRKSRDRTTTVRPLPSDTEVARHAPVQWIPTLTSELGQTNKQEQSEARSFTIAMSHFFVIIQYLYLISTLGV